MKSGFLLDTNIPSELMRPRPESRVKDWVAAQDMGSLFLSVVSIGGPLSAPDGMIAATALEHGLTVVPRNTRDFDRLNVALFNPWEATI